jgi:hypothetical protein
MAGFQIEDAAFAGVGLLAKRPLAVLTWAVLWVVVIGLVTVPFVGVLTEFLTQAARTGATPDPQTVLPLLAGLGAFALLSAIFGLAVGAVISCAVYRAIIHPEDSAFAYLRLGERELHVLLVNFVKAVLIFIVNLGLSLILTIFVLMGMAGGHGMSVGINLIGRLIVTAVGLYLQLRFALAGPMTFCDRRFRLFEAWTLSRPMQLRLLGVGAILAIIVVVVYLVVGVAGLAIGASIWNGGPHTADLHALLAQPPSIWLAALAPFVALAAGMIVIGAGILTPIVNAPWAKAYLEILEGGAKAAAEF